MAMPLLQEINAKVSPTVLCIVCGQKCQVDFIQADSLTYTYKILATCAYHGQGTTSVSKTTLMSETDVRLITLYMTPRRFMDVMRNNEMQAKERGVDWSMFDSLIKEKLSQTTYYSSITTTDGYIASENIEIPIQYEEKKPKIKPEKPPGKRKIRLNGDK